MSPVVRDATADDLELLVELNRRSATVAYRHIFGDEPFPFRAVSARFARLLGSPEHSVLVAEIDGDPAGFVVASPGLLEALYVVPEAWGRGVGSLLADRADVLVGAPAGLWVLERNLAGRRFWEHRGWAPDGAEKVEHGQVELRYARASSAAS
jgi:GNAT superfamily N-acetyltransferase